MKTVLLSRKLLSPDELMEWLENNNGFSIRNAAVEVYQSQSVHVTEGKSFYLSGSLFSHLQNTNNNP